jgi:hypothetical protein
MSARAQLKDAKLNREWHLKHSMPKNPTEEERLRWHAEHMTHCHCRDVPPKLLAEMKKRQLI